MRKKGIVGLLGLLLLGMLLLWSHPAKPGQKPAGALRIGTVNLKAQNEKPTGAAKALASADFDVLLLQEWTGENLSLSALQAEGLRLVLSDPRQGTHGAALLARPGLVKEARITSPPWHGPCAKPITTARVEAQDVSVGVLGVHAPAPVPSCSESRYPYMNAVVALIEDGRMRRPVGAIPAGTSVVVLGDLNTLSWEAPIRSLADRGLTDGFDAGSWRLGPTWTLHPWLPALARLDYLWMPADWTAHGAWTISVPGSDHRGLLVDLVALSD